MDIFQGRIFKNHFLLIVLSILAELELVLELQTLFRVPGSNPVATNRFSLSLSLDLFLFEMCYFFWIFTEMNFVKKTYTYYYYYSLESESVQ